MKRLKIIFLMFVLIFSVACDLLPSPPNSSNESTEASVSEQADQPENTKMPEEQPDPNKNTSVTEQKDASEGDDMKNSENLEKISSRQDVLRLFPDVQDAYVADFDGNGQKEAFIIRAHEEDVQQGNPIHYYYDCTISFVNANAEETTVTKSYGFPRGLLVLENEVVFIMEENAQGPGYRSRLFTVKDGAAYEHVLEGADGRFAPTDQLFGEAMFHIDTEYGFVGFVNSYQEEEGRIDIPSYYDYDASSREFVLKKSLSREEYEAAGTNEDWENPLTKVLKEY